MPVKITRKFVYLVGDNEYADQRAAQAAAKEANWAEKREAIVELIKRADGPHEAADAIMNTFLIYSKKTGKNVGKPSRPGHSHSKKRELYDEVVEDATINNS